MRRHHEENVHMAYSLKNHRYRYRNASRRVSARIVMELRAENDYMLWLKFDDGVEGRVYLGDLMETEAYGARVDQGDFFKVRVDPLSRAVTWESGVHIDPDVLYRNIASQAAAQSGPPLH
jgi:hypothetical protein